MVSEIQQRCAESYEKHKHLKIVGEDVGIPWQTVYVHLRQMGVPVTGDKMAYGSPTDKLACLGEQIFHQLVPVAIDKNKQKFQAKVDFQVSGWLVDVKTSKRKKINKKYNSKAWSFCIRKQNIEADFFVCLGLDEERTLEKIFLIPAEMVRGKQSISIPISMRSKWAAFVLTEDELPEFFSQLPIKI
jgi:hypothetical protein